jgi:hypothetical protein
MAWGLLRAAYRARPERFPNGAPTVPLPPAAVYINPLFTEIVDITEPPSNADTAVTARQRCQRCVGVRTWIRPEPGAALHTGDAQPGDLQS